MTSRLHPCLNPSGIFTRCGTSAQESRARAGMIRAAPAIAALGFLCATARAQDSDPRNDAAATGGAIGDVVSGNHVVGYFKDGSGHYHGFVYNGSTYTPLNDPSATGSTYASSMPGSTIVDQYRKDSGMHRLKHSPPSTNGTLKPGGVSLWIGMGITGAGLLVRRRRRAARARLESWLDEDDIEDLEDI